MLFTLALISVVVGLIYLYFVWNFNYWKNKGVAGPKPIPVIGAFPGQFMQTRNLAYEVDELYKKYRSTTPYIGFFSFRNPVLMALDLATVKDVLITNFKSFHDNEFGSTQIDKETDPILARNPFLSSGEEWKEKRAEITPAFTHSKIKSMYPIMTDVCKKMTVYLKKQLTKDLPDGIDAKDLGANFTTDVVSSAIYGVDSKSFSGEESIIRKMGSSLFEFSFKLIVYFTLVQVFPFITKIFTVGMMPKRVEKFFTQLTNDAIKLRETSGVDRDDYLGYLLQLRAKKNLAPIDMAAHTLTFFLDGFETSSVVISHMLYQLATNIECQHRLRTEINKSIKQHGSVTYESIGEMLYLDQVFHETLRMHPAVGGMTRKCTESIELTDYKDKKILIEKGTSVFIPVWSIQHDAEFYPNPKVFDPERFSEDNGGAKKYKDLGAFLGFGDGPRICLGMRFGTLQVKTAVIECIKNFDITVNKKTKVPYVLDPKNFLLAPVGGIWLNFKAIEG